MKYLTIAETRAIMERYIGDKELLRIEEDSVKDFKWGSLFILESANSEETGNIAGLPYFLVDKITGEVITIDYQKNIDYQLERYREEKGYEHVIKFPVKGDLNRMSPIEKVFAFCKTEELFQVKRAIRIIESNNLFSVIGFAEICRGRKTNRIAESISRINHIKGNYHLYESNLKIIPDEIGLFRDEITSLIIDRGEIEIISGEITKLENLVSIKIELAPIKAMPFDLSNLKKLKELSIIRTKLSIQDKSKFVVPENCEVIIE